MARLFHRTRGQTAAELIGSVARRLKRARVFFGHGTDNARDEAAALVLHVMRIAHDAPPRALRRRATAAERSGIEALLQRRIDERRPLAYLMHEAWFAG